MRVIAGEYKGFRLTAPPGRDVRPTTDRVKEAMFAAIQFDLPGAVVLDMFSGSGALGIEAASRGAQQVVLCEADRRAAGVIRENLRRLGNPGNIELMPVTYQKALRRLEGDTTFDIVFLDPPYHADAYVPALEALAAASVIGEDSLLILESDAELKLNLPEYKTERVKKYGNTFITWERLFV